MMVQRKLYNLSFEQEIVMDEVRASMQAVDINYAIFLNGQEGKAVLLSNMSLENIIQLVGEGLEAAKEQANAKPM